MSDSIINLEILGKCGGELGHAITKKCIELCSKDEYINSMGDISTRTRILKVWTRTPVVSNMIPKSSIEERKTEITVIKFHRCGRNSNLENTSTQKAKINELKDF
ncbi:hypothetical protein O181_014241 [Austropuccinia psidii MF-1]|uniref:Uncharacterized protein n=1 Tax=Austropuccinia psidii MF-1 TaxID=1389203 RepID=A0A9Q3BXS3_9BASI|nr:hypothetical protein [Austropuccinia psidii MF-1]